MGAISAVTLGLLHSGDHVVIGEDVYGGTNRLFTQILPRFSIETTFADSTDLTNLEQAIKPNTKVLIWVETPTNPTMKITDIKAAAVIAKKHHITLAVDNTFLTPYLQRPLDLGADLTMYSISKYMNGHSDVIMGSIATNNEQIYIKLKFVQNAMGIIPGPFDCYQVDRGLKTLALRMEKHKANSQLVGKFLERHPKVEKVIHPGLPSHPQHELFKKQTSGDSGTFSMYLRGGLEESEAFLKAVKVFTLAGSLGGYQSLIELPCKMSHASVEPEMRKQLGISENLIRLSIGLEDPEYLIADLDQALKKME
nr:unnamed protein product [Callosobruchus chinensis]